MRFFRPMGHVDTQSYTIVLPRLRLPGAWISYAERVIRKVNCNPNWNFFHTPWVISCKKKKISIFQLPTLQLDLLRTW